MLVGVQEDRHAGLADGGIGERMDFGGGHPGVDDAQPSRLSVIARAQLGARPRDFGTPAAHRRRSPRCSYLKRANPLSTIQHRWRAHLQQAFGEGDLTQRTQANGRG